MFDRISLPFVSGHTVLLERVQLLLVSVCLGSQVSSLVFRFLRLVSPFASFAALFTVHESHSPDQRNPSTPLCTLAVVLEI